MLDRLSERTPQVPPLQVPWGLGMALGALFIAFAISNLGAFAVAALNPDAFAHSTLLLDIGIYQLLALGALVCVVFIIVYYQVDPETIGYRLPGGQALIFAILAVPVIILAADLIATLWNVLFPHFQLRGNTDEIPAVHGTGQRIVTAVWAIVEAPLVEETLFRGILFQGLRHFFLRWLSYHWSVGVAAVISGVIFGLAHGEPHTLPILAVTGIALAYIFQYTRSLFASATAHGVVNALAIASIFLHG